MKSTRATLGFTVIEVLVSLAIFALAAIALGGAYCNTVENIHSASRFQEEAGDLRTIRALLLSEPERQKAERGGELVMADGKRLTWTAEIDPTQVGDLFRVKLNYKTLECDAALSWKRTESFMLMRPTWSEGDARDKLRGEAKARLERGGPR